jgi:hypothetical protein
MEEFDSITELWEGGLNLLKGVLQVDALNRLHSSEQCYYDNNVRDDMYVKYKSATQLISNCNEKLPT